MEQIGGVGDHWWWAAASTGQLGMGIRFYRRGYSGGSQLMPLKAFGVASLFVGATATAAFALLRSYGIHSVEDMKVSGAKIRTGLGVPPRTYNNLPEDHTK